MKVEIQGGASIERKAHPIIAGAVHVKGTKEGEALFGSSPPSMQAWCVQ